MHILAQPRQEEDQSVHSRSNEPDFKSPAPELTTQRPYQWTSRAPTSCLGNQGTESQI